MLKIVIQFLWIYEVLLFYCTFEEEQKQKSHIASYKIIIHSSCMYFRGDRWEKGWRERKEWSGYVLRGSGHVCWTLQCKLSNEIETTTVNDIDISTVVRNVIIVNKVYELLSSFQWNKINFTGNWSIGKCLEKKKFSLLTIEI